MSGLPGPAARHWSAVLSLPSVGVAVAALSFAAVLCALSAAPIAAKPEYEPRGMSRSEPGDAPVAVEDTLTRVDMMLARMDARRRDAWARADEMLDLADAAKDPEEQMRLEELYGKLAAVAGNFDEQYSRLSALRDELAAARDRMPP